MHDDEHKCIFLSLLLGIYYQLFSILKRLITVVPVEIPDKEYDSIAVKYNPYDWNYSDSTVYELLDGHYLTIEVKFKNSEGKVIYNPLDASIYTFVLADFMVNDSEEMTNNYDVKFEEGNEYSFEIKPRDVVLLAASSLFNIYDGNAVIDVIDNYSIISGMFYGNDCISVFFQIVFNINQIISINMDFNMYKCKL